MLGLKFKSPKSGRKMMRELRRKGSGSLPHSAEEQLLQQLRRQRQQLLSRWKFKNVRPDGVGELTRECLQLAEQIYTEDSCEFVEELHVLALWHFAQHDYEALIATLENRLPIVKKHSCPYEYLDILGFLLVACCELDKQDEAEKVLAEGLSVTKKLLDPENHEYPEHDGSHGLRVGSWYKAAQARAE